FTELSTDGVEPASDFTPTFSAVGTLHRVDDARVADGQVELGGSLQVAPVTPVVRSDDKSVLVEESLEFFSGHVVRTGELDSLVASCGSDGESFLQAAGQGIHLDGERYGVFLGSFSSGLVVDTVDGCFGVGPEEAATVVYEIECTV